MIRKRDCVQADLSLGSHNRARPDEDFGIKYNISNGPAPDKIITPFISAASRLSAITLTAPLLISITTAHSSWAFDDLWESSGRVMPTDGTPV